ncbi:MAG: FAD-dependent oxidoreductase [Steroidobacteraceae bacterium]
MTRRYDLAVVGGGIHGAGLAQAAAAAGHRVLLLEKSTIGAGTSSRSSKLIHGGLRYLESAQLRLVRESLHERTLLLRNAPELVRLVRFRVPLYRSTRRRSWQLLLGLSMYAALAGFRRGANFGLIARRHWDELDGLELAHLKRVFWYHDAQTDDRALTAAVARSASGLGAEILCSAQFIRADLHQEGVNISYLHDGAEAECAARVLVNAAGPWAREVQARIAPAVPVPQVELVQGAHVLVDVADPGGYYYVESPRDGRAVFVMPWQGRLLVGTTELRYRASPDRVAPSVAEKHYLVKVLAHYFPRYRDLRVADLGGSFAGLRVLPCGSGHAFHRSRETHFELDRPHSPRVLGIFGGKLTTYRATAASAMQRIATSLPRRRAIARTDRLRLTPQ